MQRHRLAAKKSTVLRKWKDDPRMTHVQTMLQSVQVRTVQPLEELLQESKLSPQSCVNKQSDVCLRTQDGPPLTSDFANENNSHSFLASMCCGLGTSVTFQQKCLREDNEESRPSSGYFTYSQKKQFLRKTEKRLEDSSSSSDSQKLILLKDSPSCAQGSEGESESCHPDSLEVKMTLPSSEALAQDCDGNRVSASDSLEFMSTLSTCNSSPPSSQTRQDLGRTEPAHVQLEEPHRLSLQALLRKSQAYRRSQRVLRNQAKQMKSQEMTQDQQGDEGVEQSLSDKENNGSPARRSPPQWRSQGATKDRRGADRTNTPKTKVLLGTSLGADRMVQAVRYHYRPPAVLSTLTNVGEGGMSDVLVTHSQNMDHLESSLSGLKVVLSDLQSKLAEDIKPGGLLATGHIKKGDLQDDTLREFPRGEDTEPEPSLSLCGLGTKAVKTQESSGTNPLSRSHMMHHIPSDGSSALTHSCTLPEETSMHTPNTRFHRQPIAQPVYDINAPAGLWFLQGSESLLTSKHLTPEDGAEGHRGVDKVTRRLLMPTAEHTQEEREGTHGGAESGFRLDPGTTRACSYEGRGAQRDEMLGVLHDVRHVQSACLLPDHCCPLLAAAVKGFLTRRLLRTERMEQLVRTFHDTRQFLQAFQEQSPTEDICSREDVLLQQRVALQMCSARYKVYDTFFNLSIMEQMQLITWDRGVARQRHLSQGDLLHPRGQSYLSAATQKSLQRRER
ncbi:uncharacterized protein si:ch73-100l22.3 [Thalassophryne amazonica]|uniref:uncharacterized protein si:ch73-100l22.3 n=1 Tax=Thalassophryne amazonica TaxID=390379 RepID=UPI001470BCE0|nr:uncharacterized protein si:ch73-100l22.3 [Thalassophryne amazonica]